MSPLSKAPGTSGAAGGGAGVSAWDSSTAYASGSQVTFGGYTWQANVDTAPQHAPQGVGDGTTADRDLLLGQLTRGWAGGLVTGGYAGSTYHVTNGNDSGAGSLRAGLEDVNPLWIVFDGNYTIVTTSRVDIRPNKTIDGRGRTVKVSGQGAGRFQNLTNGDPTSTAANLIWAYVTFDDIWVDTSTSSAFKAGGNTIGNAGSADKIYVHHVSFQSISDSVFNMGFVGTNISRSTVDWSKTGPNPDADLVAANGLINPVGATGGFHACTAVASTDVFTSTTHPFFQGQEVYLISRASGALPGGFVAGTSYYVRDVTANTFKLSATRDNTTTPSNGGSLKDVTSDGSCWLVSLDDQSQGKVPTGYEGRGGDPYMSGKGMQWGVNHGSDGTTGDYDGYLRTTVTLCDWRNGIIRQPKFQGAWGHLFNNRVYKWGNVQSSAGVGGGNGHEFDQNSQALLEYEIFDAYQTGERHWWSDLVPSVETLPADGTSTRAINRISGSANTKLVGCWTDGSTGTSTSPSASTSDSNNVDPTWLPVPYSYTPVTTRATLVQMLDRGAGNVQPWTRL